MLTESGYTMLLEFLEGGNFYADYIIFESVVAVENKSWGAIKSMYRD